MKKTKKMIPLTPEQITANENAAKAQAAANKRLDASEKRKEAVVVQKAEEARKHAELAAGRPQMRHILARDYGKNGLVEHPAN